MPSFVERIQNAWDVFTNRAPSKVDTSELGPGSARRPDRTKLLRSNERTIMAPVLNRIAMDVSAVTIKHVRLDGHGRYSETVDSSFNDCLNLSANLDLFPSSLRLLFTHVILNSVRKLNNQIQFT